MNPDLPLKPFVPQAPDAAGMVTWVHIGDLHMTLAGEQNQRDLVAMVAKLNEAFAEGTSFVYLPGDVADHGSAEEYQVVRQALDQLRLPWCSIVGDHDVHEKSFGPFLSSMATETHYSFEVGDLRFFALNAFDIPDPGSFAMLPEQLSWLERELSGFRPNESAVLLLHCYPSDLKQGGERLRRIVFYPAVRLVDMGHTHYNELANDGRTLYTATRSTGQIEEGPVGFSITNVDGPVVSWKFLPLGELPAVMITSPSDERFITEPSADVLIAMNRQNGLKVRAKGWSGAPVLDITATLGEETLRLMNIADNVWEGEFAAGRLPGAGVHRLAVTLRDAQGNTARDEIRCVYGRSAYRSVEREERDQDNAIPSWPERGLLGTQLGPNKNGRKW